MGMQDLREMTRAELEAKFNDLEDERFNLRMRASFKALDNPLRLRTLRRDVARIQTLLREDDMGTRKLARSKASILDMADAGKKEKK